MKKRFLTLMAVMGLSLALVACGGSKAEEEKPVKESTGKVSALVLEDENKKISEKEAESETEENTTDGSDEGEVLDGTDKDNMMVDPENAEDWSDFTADTVLVPEDEVIEQIIIPISKDYYEMFRLDFNHQDEVEKIEYFELIDQDKTAAGDYSDENRYLMTTSASDEFDFTSDAIFLRYSVPEIIPNLLIRFTSKGGNVKEFICQYNGRDGGAFLADITPEFTR